MTRRGRRPCARGERSSPNALDWPDSRAERPWKYYDATRIGLTPETPLADVGVTITGDAAGYAQRFGEAKGAAAETIARHAGTVVLPETDRLTALHYALLRDGVLVNVPANVEVAEPIRLVRSVSRAGVSTPHTLIVTGANSRVTVVQEYTSSDEAIVALPVAEIIPGPGSEVSLLLHPQLGGTDEGVRTPALPGGADDAATSGTCTWSWAARW